MQKLKVAFVGCGGISGFHTSHLVEFDDVEFVGMMDIRHEKAVARAESVGGAPIFDNYVEMLDTAKPDVLYICVPPDQHGTIEREAIARDIPFFVEKPMALSMELAYELCEAIDKKGLITGVGFQDRYLDIIAKTKEMLVGRTPALVDGTWLGTIPGAYWWSTYATSGGQIVEQNIHLFDMIRYLFGEPASVYCTGLRGIVTREGYDLHDCSSAVITMQDGPIVTMFTGCFYDHNVPHKNGLNIKCVDADIHYVLRQSVTLDTGIMQQTFLRQYDQGVTEDRVFLDAIKSGDPSAIRSPYSDAVKSLRLTLACNDSINTGKVIDLR